MFSRRLFISKLNTANESVVNAGHVQIVDGVMKYNPLDNIRIDDKGQVFYSEENRNGALHLDGNGAVFARRSI